jgi:hypothetical protein
MSGRIKISGWILAGCLLTVPALAQGGGGPRSGGGPPGPHHGDWLRKNLNTPPAQQQRELENDPKFQKLPPERQERLKQRLKWFNSLSPNQQQKILQRQEKWEHMTPQQHDQARSVFDRLQAMPEERRNSIRQQMHAFSGMTPEQQQNFMNSDQFKREFSPDERDVMQRWLSLRNSNTESASPTLDEPQQR